MSMQSKESRVPSDVPLGKYHVIYFPLAPTYPGRNQQHGGSQAGEMLFFRGMQVTTAAGPNCIMSESNINTQNILNSLIE